MALKVIAYKWHDEQKKHDGHARPAVGKGAIVWAIVDEASGDYFYYAYLDANYAEHVCARMGRVRDDIDARANYRRRPQAVTERTSDNDGAKHVRRTE